MSMENLNNNPWNSGWLRHGRRSCSCWSFLNSARTFDVKVTLGLWLPSSYKVWFSSVSDVPLPKNLYGWQFILLLKTKIILKAANRKKKASHCFESLSLGRILANYFFKYLLWLTNIKLTFSGPLSQHSTEQSGEEKWKWKWKIQRPAFLLVL
jgi:hypothetical protein